MDLLWELFTLVLALLGVLIAYVWYYKSQIEAQLKWANVVPGIPILGNALEFGSTTTHIPTTLRLLDETKSDTMVLSIMHKFSIFSRDYKFLEFILGSTKVLNKSYDYYCFLNWLGTGLLTADGPKWKPRRKIITPAFHFGVLEQFVQTFDSNGQIMIEKLQKEVGKDSVNIYTYITLCALDIICETAMGVSVNAQENTESDYVLSVKTLCRIIIDRLFSPIKMFDFLYQFSSDYQTEKKCLKILHGYTNSVISKRMEELKNKENSSHNESFDEDDVGVKRKKAFLDLLLEAKINGEPLSKEDIREEVDTFMFEGHDTTASAMSFALYCLANDAEVQNRALEEQIEIFGKDDLNRPTTHQDLMGMKYLELVIKEALRLYPSVPFIGRYFHEDVEYDGNIIPKGTSFTALIYGLNYHPDFYPEPEKFDPSRFEESAGKHRKPYAYLSFSAGPRNCIGQKFAMLEMKCTLSKMLRNFELLPAIPEHKLQLASETVLKSLNGVNIRLKSRRS